MIINGIHIDSEKLMSKDALLEFLRENGESDRALSYIREKYRGEFGNELIWLYPISDGKHLGTFIVAVREGFISLPYSAADKEDYELLELDDAAAFDEDAIQCFIDDWHSFSDDLVSAMIDMLRILRDK
jgi:hypothetical protein